MCSMVLSFTLSPAKNLQITQIQNIKIILIVTGQFAVSYWKFWVLLGFLPHLSDCLLPGHVLHSLQEFPGLVIHSFYLSPGLGTSTCQFKHYTFIIEIVLGLSCIFKDVSIIINRRKKFELKWTAQLLSSSYHPHGFDRHGRTVYLTANVFTFSESSFTPPHFLFWDH